MKIGFVILHYKTTNDTIECINSLKELDGSKLFKIYVVDNYSNNGSVEKLEEIYKEDPQVIFIKSKKNLGFANGNNLGIQKANEEKCDFIILLNNDTYIKQKDFVKQIVSAWKKTHFAIGGPRIVSAIDGMDQNPFMIRRHFIKNKKMAWRLYFYGLIKYIFVLLRLPLFWESSSGRYNLNEGLANQELNSQEQDFLLYGACLILSPDYLHQYNKLCSLTFMYEEETIIYMLSRLLNYRVAYIPSAQIFHKEQSSTKKSLGVGRRRLLFGYREDFKSRKQVLKLMLHRSDKEYLKSQLINGKNV